ncbi:MAG: DUF3373 family protein [Desulfobacteraceae bacterium]|nr:MAG: DUF3373 family protein [Desulfobacteraceae bacterium]
MKRTTPFFKPIFFLSAVAFLLAIALPFPAAASNCSKKCATEDCKSKCSVNTLKEEVSSLQKKVENLEKQNDWAQDDMEDMSGRLDKAEMHTATDKVSFGVYLRTRADSIHYDDMRGAPASLMGAFFAPPPYGFNGATLPQIQQGMQQMAMNGMIPPPESYDADNDIIYTNKFRLDMKARVNENLRFDGRLAAYKVYGDSSGVKFNQGSLGDVTFDGNTSSLPHGDTIHLERAYFVYSQEYGAVPVSLSLGRRPSTDGPPLEYGNYDVVGGSPFASIINWQFDGASLSFGLENIVPVPGASFKLCYGLGYEADWGNSNSLNYSGSDLEDVHLLGFITDLYSKDRTSLGLNYAHAFDITDGFTGTSVMPFTIAKQDTNGDGEAEYYFEQNTGGFISRLEPMTNIGDWDAASLLYRTNLSDKFADIDLFLAGSWTHTNPTEISKNPFYEMMGMGLLSSNGDLQSRDGYGIYTGALFPMPYQARLGLEYNWGSKYWFNFTGAEDSLIGSKLAVRGDVYEAYYIQPIIDKNFFVRVGTQYYDYKYTGSGNPLGKPVEIASANALDTINPVADEVWNYYLSATLSF